MGVEKANEILLAICGENIKDQAKAMYIKNKILNIACLSSIAAQEIKFKEKDLIAKINSNGKVVDKIRYIS